MKNFCFGTVVPAINSAENILDAWKKKLSSAQKSSKIGIVE